MQIGPSGETLAGSGLCYFLVCFRSTEFVAFLLSSLFQSNDLFLIHCDKKSPDNLKGFLQIASKNYENIIVLESQDYSWAGYSHVRISLQAICQALALEQKWSHFIFLSEQHLPVKSPAEIHNFLTGRKSIAMLSRTADMTGVELSDIRNRFGARYRELPGVGCFATDLIVREEEFFNAIFHGSNWIVLHREDCIRLCKADLQGKFDLFHNAVHAEETAIQSIIASFGSGCQRLDSTLVAFPHHTDNLDLIMTEDLFKLAINTDYLFIRKRPRKLSDFVVDFIKKNGFNDDLYALCGRSLQEADTDGNELQDTYLDTFRSAFGGRILKPVTIEAVDPKIFTSSPKFHLIVVNSALRPNLSVRVLSENLLDFRVLIVEDIIYDGVFEQPFVYNKHLYSTIRARIYSLFGHMDILPLEVDNAGFVSIEPGQPLTEVIFLTSRFLDLATTLCKKPRISSRPIT